MLRKLSLAAVACMALSLVAFAPSAVAGDPEPFCAGKPDGVYNDAGLLGKFDLTFNPTTAHAAAEVNGGAILCGTETDPPGLGGVFYTNGYILFPGYVPGLPGSGTRPVCARQSPTVALCDINGNGTVDSWENIPDGSYSGSSQSDVWCDTAICEALGIQDNPDTLTKNYVRYAASGNAKCGGATVVACFQAEAQIGPAACDADIATYKMGGSYLMGIFKPTCTGGTATNPTYFYTIDNLTICKYAGDVGGTACGTSGRPVQFNGNAGTYAFYLIAQMTDGSSHTAIATGAWT